MQVRIEEVSPVERKLIVEVPWPTVEGRLLDAYRELGKSVQLKGFRKGKVPKSVLERMFGKRVRAEVVGQLVRESFVTAATEHNLEAVSEPRVEEDPKIVKGESLSFEAIVEVKGEVVAENYDKLELSRRVVKIEDEAVERALEQVQREQTELRPIEGREELATSDFVAISLKGKIGDHDVDRPQMTVDLGEEEKEPLPGLVRALTGLKVNAADQPLEIDIPEDHQDEQIAGKKASLVVSVIDAREKDVPALDDDLAKDTGEADTLEELRNVLRRKLEERMEEEIRSELRNQALKKLVERNPIPIASSLVERAAELKTRRFEAMLGLSPGQEGVLGDEILGKLREGADDDVRGQLLLDAVASQEGISVTDEELDAKIQRLASAQGQVPARMRAEMDRDGSLENLKFQLLQEKVLDFLVDKAEVTEVEASAEEEAGAEEPGGPGEGGGAAGEAAGEERGEGQAP